MNTNRFPVERVSWSDAAEFCRQLSELPEEIAAGRSYRLPTEAQWEYACRAGTTTAYFWGDTNGPKNSPMDEYFIGFFPQQVGQRKPNPWGLYDISGNVFEWCADWFDPKYAASPASDPVGPAEGTGRVIRGGDLFCGFGGRMTARSACRDGIAPNATGHRRGFRVACDIRPVAPDPAAVASAIPADKAAAEARLKSKGLMRRDFYFVVPDEVQFIRYVSTLDRLRAECFNVQKERQEAERQLSLVKSSQIGVLASRVKARTYTSYSSTWREHRAGVRARNNATDALKMVDLAKEDIEKWLNDCQDDYAESVSRLGDQCRKLREMFTAFEAAERKLASDYEVTQALSQLSSPTKKYQLGPSPGALGAVKKLASEEAQYAQLTGK